MDHTIYRDKVLQVVPRILGLVDRNAPSKTFGCGDRAFWKYRTIDLANSRYQEYVLLLSVLYTHLFPGNDYHQKAPVRSWIQAGIVYWNDHCIHHNGSTEEVYPFENSVCATAFSTVAITESCLLLKEPAPSRIKKVGDWLIKNVGYQTANQTAAVMVALLNIHTLTTDARYKSAALKIAERLSAENSATPFFSEYGGFDLGYNSLTTSLLQTFQQRTGDTLLKEKIMASCRHMDSQITADGHFDSTVMSRNTQFFYPSCTLGYEPLRKKHLSGLEKNTVLNPAWLDDRYVIPLTIDYLRTYLELL